MVARWVEKASEVLYQSRIFSIRRAQFAQTNPKKAAEEPLTHECYLVDSPDWVNVIALTKQGTVLFVRQFRFGIHRVTLEIPGGMIDPDESPEHAAVRELREKTGYESQSWASLGWVDPNPALLGNRCYTFVASNCVLAQSQAQSPQEQVSVEEQDLSEVPKLIAAGEITHALVAVAFMRFDLHQRGLF